MAEQLMQQHDAVDLIAAALKNLTREPNDTPVKITEERPLPSRRTGGRGHDRNRGGGGRRRNNNFRGGDRNRRSGGGSRRREGSRGNRSTNNSK